MSDTESVNSVANSTIDFDFLPVQNDEDGYRLKIWFVHEMKKTLDVRGYDLNYHDGLLIERSVQDNLFVEDTEREYEPRWQVNYMTMEELQELVPFVCDLHIQGNDMWFAINGLHRVEPETP